MNKIYLIVLFLILGSTINTNAQTKLTLMQFNVRSFEDQNFNVDKYAKVFNEHKPDIICLNEVENRSSRNMVNGKYRDVTYDLANKLNMFALYGYAYSLNNKQGDNPLENYKYEKNELYGNAILSKYPILNSVSYELPRPKESADQRQITIADILLPNNHIIRVVVTHLDHIGGQEAQQAFIGKLQEMHSDIPTLFMGDFNYNVAPEIAKNYDIFFTGSWGIDHILGNKGNWEKISTAELSRYYEGEELSDHDPIKCVVKCLKF